MRITKTMEPEGDRDNQIVISALDIILKRLVKELEDLEIRRQVETI